MARNHPYLGRPDYQFWRKDPALGDPALFDPVSPPGFSIVATDRIVTAGSCFAQHVARHLAQSGFDFLVTEQPHPVIPPKVAADMNYGLFSARYGNLYTARQLKQLLQRAYGEFTPLSSAWALTDRRYVDPFRPQILPGGYLSERELEMDRAVHLAAVREAIERMTVFVFTLGLTETWLDRRDGAVFPVAPGVAGGVYDPAIHAFHNLSVDEVVADMQWSLDFIRRVNPGVKVVVTVSPVPLNATALDRHVAVSTTYSKAVLRVAAEQVTMDNALCDYFPSYEIITSSFTRSNYYQEDGREITPAGVEHVMGLFLKYYGDISNGSMSSKVTGPSAARSKDVTREAERLMSVLCDEEAIDNS